MTTIDYLVLLGYLFGVLVAGFIFAGANKNSSEMFAAGGRSPWWAAGLSGFMTMFSAATFVVWGGIAYKHGIVAVIINLCYGVAALLVGYFVAGRWKELGIRTPGEFVQLRFGRAALHFYTWSMMLFRLVGSGVALYSLALLLVALMPLAEGNPFRDPSTGNLSLFWAIALFGGIIVAYTMVGGLWAVLMTDVVQSVVLNLAVLFVVPLSLMQVGGFTNFVEQAPAGFFAPISGGYTWFFLAGWCAIHFFMIGAEWAYVQRFICVPTSRDARKGAYLFGILYLISPIVWLLPPLLWRIQSPIPIGATEQEIQQLAERAYIESCRAVLPAGMVGLMLAAMFSATASGLSGQLNVFAGVLTRDIYRPLMGNRLDERQLVRAGRVFTILLGFVVLGVAISVPYIGGAEALIVASTSLVATPLLAPAIWGLFSPRVNAAAVWATAATCIALALLIKLGFLESGPLSHFESLGQFGKWLRVNQTAVDTTLGVIVPTAVLLIVQGLCRGESIGWRRVAALPRPAESSQPELREANRLPVLVVGWSVAICGAMMSILIFYNDDGTDRSVLAAFASVLFVIASIVLRHTWRGPRPAAARLEASHAEV
jgi:solute:Na+ symporter, SSS family